MEYGMLHLINNSKTRNIIGILAIIIIYATPPIWIFRKSGFIDQILWLFICSGTFLIGVFIIFKYLDELQRLIKKNLLKSKFNRAKTLFFTLSFCVIATVIAIWLAKILFRYL
ncbi:MAG: hypothetical protein AB7U85_09490 [Alphaproteobacteria bacterium]